MSNAKTRSDESNENLQPYASQEGFLGENQVVDDNFHPQQPQAQRQAEGNLSSAPAGPAGTTAPNKNNRRRRAPFRSVRRNHRLNFHKTPLQEEGHR